MDKFRLIVVDSEVGIFNSVKKAKEKALEINPDVEFYLNRKSYKQGRNIYYSTASNPSMRIELVQETREEKIQRWVKKTKKRIARENADYKRFRDSESAEKQKLANLMADDIYMSVPEDIRDDVYELLEAELETENEL